MLRRLAPEGDRAVAGQKSQPMGAKATEGKGDKPAIGPKRGSAVSSSLQNMPQKSVIHFIITF